MAFSNVALAAAVLSQATGLQQANLPRARLHHVHINSVDPDASIKYYTSRFKAAAGTFGGEKALSVNGMWFLYSKVSKRAPAEPIASLWHIGFGSPDVKATYEHFLRLGELSEPLTNAGEFSSGKARTAGFHVRARRRWYAALPGQRSGRQGNDHRCAGCRIWPLLNAVAGGNSDDYWLRLRNDPTESKSCAGRRCLG